MRSVVKRGGGWGAVAVALFLALAGCGGSGGSSADLSSGSGGSDGIGIVSTFNTPSEMTVGGIMAIDFGSSDSANVDFSGVDLDASFILAVGSYNTSGVGTSMQISADTVLPEGDPLAKGMGVNIAAAEDVVDESEAFGPQEILSAWLRAAESELPESEDLPVSFKAASYSKSPVFKAGMGATEVFRVLSSLSSVSSYVEVTGEVRCVGENILVYVDTAVEKDILSDDDVNTLCDDFDTVAGQEQEMFGATSDVDDDGRIHVLMTKQVNRLGALGGGIITGYFYAADLYDRGNSNQVSNNREIIYTMVPDPTGQYGTQVSNNFAMSNLLPAVLPHELQHAINYNQHVFANGGGSEENWLNEALSHLAEDLMGFNRENPSRYAMFLASPSTYGVVTQSSPNLIERGASYLFMRFLYEQSGNPEEFIKSLENTGLRGVENLERAFDGPAGFSGFSEFMTRWSVALALTDRGITSDSRYTYRARTKNSTTGNWDGVCLSCEAEDGRGTVINGVNLNAYYGSHSPKIDASATIYYSITSVPNTVTLAGTAEGGNFGFLIRTQ